MKTRPTTEPVCERSLTGPQLASCVGALSPMTGLVAYGKARERMGMVADRLDTMQLFRDMGALGPEQESQMVEFKARYDKARRQSERLGERLNARFKAW
jgi:hypothetical protein